MVSKIAVIALVAIVACPILLGYAMNLSETTVTEYRNDGDKVNVTPLLQSGIEFSYAHADTTDLNTKFMRYGIRTTPDYASVSTIKTAVPMIHQQYANSDFPSGGYETLSAFYILNYIFSYDPSSSYMTITITWDNNGVNTTTIVDRIYSFYYSNGVLTYNYYAQLSGGQWYVPDNSNTIVNPLRIDFLKSSAAYSANVERFIVYDYSIPSTTFADISSGFYLNTVTYNGASLNQTYLDLPENPRNILITMDLNSITDANYSFNVIGQISTNNVIRFDKTTDAEGVHWAAYDYNGDLVANLYYDSTRSSNTYQLLMDLDGYELRYVGSWPKLIGYANYYITYENSWNQIDEITFNLGSVYFQGRTPLMRIDDSEYRAFENVIIQDITYQPSQFKLNPATKIGSPTMYGSSIEFGGITYTVTNGSIMIGTHKVPLKDAVFDSIPGIGGYNNRINGTVVSVTLAPSDITFNGKWSANITTDSMRATNVTKTEWTPGKFAWNGIDDNFLMIGLTTSVGVFIGLSIYARRTGASIWPLLLVCGGAALLFFCML